MFLTTNNEVIGSLKSRSRHNKPYAHLHHAYYYPLLVLSLVIKQLFHTFQCNSQNSHPLGAVNDPMHCRNRPPASGNSASGHPQHHEGDSFDCCTDTHVVWNSFIMSSTTFLWCQKSEQSIKVLSLLYLLRGETAKHAIVMQPKLVSYSSFSFLNNYKQEEKHLFYKIIHFSMQFSAVLNIFIMKT